MEPIIVDIPRLGKFLERTFRLALFSWDRRVGLRLVVGDGFLGKGI
jgi:hypothetical protein